MIVRPGTHFDIYRYCRAERLTQPDFAYFELYMQALRSPFYTVRIRGSRTPLALWGVMPENGSSSQAWFSCSAELAVMPRMGACVVLAIAKAFAGEAAGHERGVVCRVRPSDGAGARIARVLNFAPTGVMLADGELWRYENG